MGWEKSIYMRYFLQCKVKDCGFIVPLLSQANREPDICPCCGETQLDYAPKSVREEYVKSLRQELQGMEEDGE